MTVRMILLPVFVQVGIIFTLLLLQASARFGALSSGKVKPKDISLREPNWPKYPTQVANAFSNQFEMPILFLVLVAFAMITQKADYLFVALAWVFVLFRLLHAYIFVTSNNIRYRFLYFLASCLTLMAMWVLFALKILAA